MNKLANTYGIKCIEKRSIRLASMSIIHSFISQVYHLQPELPPLLQ